MSSIRNNKNIQSAISSGVFVGLRAEHCHVSELHSTKFHSDDGLDVFSTLKDLQEKYTQLLQKVESLKLSDLKDVNLTNAKNDDALVFHDNVWQPAEMNDDSADA